MRTYVTILSVFILITLIPPLVSAQTQPIYKQRIAISHDGNRADCDDIGALAWDFAVIWSFGMASKLVHLDYADNLNPSEGTQCSNQYTEIKKSGTEGPQNFPGFNASKIFDCQSNLSGAIANFKAEAEKGGPGDTLALLVAGPCEVPWRMINAVAVDKRQYIKCISHGSWNENYSGTNMTHNWAKMKSDFPTVKYIDIIDQNDYVGKRYSGISTAWNFLNSMPVVCNLPTSSWTWLRSRDKKNGDVSDVGMTWYLLTGDQKGTPPDYEKQFKNPACKGITANESPVLSKLAFTNGLQSINTKGAQVSFTYVTSGEYPVSLQVFMTSGVKVAHLPVVSSRGTHVATWNKSGLANGNYIVRTEIDQKVRNHLFVTR